MTEKRIQRKHFLAALGAAVVGFVGIRAAPLSRNATSKSNIASAGDLPVPAADPRSVSRPSARG